MLDPEIFAATFKAHGLYNSEQFVLRLSPKNHALVDRITSGDFDPRNIEEDMLQAFSTYLHETIHWWQHIGSTSGFVLSMCYPLQLHSTLAHIQHWCSSGEATKPIKASAIEGQCNGIMHSDERQASANMILNFTADFENFRTWLLDPEKAEEIYRDEHFESQGHCFRIVYGDLVENFASQIDPEYKVITHPKKWVDDFDRAARERIMGFYRGSPILRRLVGVKDLFEGQACFSQMQFLTLSTSAKGDLRQFREIGMLHGIYEHAFTEFFRLIETDPPDNVLDPLVGLFLLVCDVAINPMEGLLCDIPSVPDFVNDADPGLRFQMLCNVVRDHKETVIGYIETYSAEEYSNIADFLSEVAGFIPPSKGWEVIRRLSEESPAFTEMMEAHSRLRYGDANVVMRVLISHFISFAIDKSENPHFFCWSGLWMANMKNGDWISRLWLKHLSLFSDREDDDGIFIRKRPGVDELDLTQTFQRFFGNLIVSNLTRQWVLYSGDFNFDFRWLSENKTPEYWKDLSERSFEQLYGIKIDTVRPTD